MIQINIQFLQQPVDGDFISFEVNLEQFNNTISFTFRDTVTTPNSEVQIGATLNDTIVNTLTFLNEYYQEWYFVRPGIWTRQGDTLVNLIPAFGTLDNIIDVPGFVVVNTEIIRTFVNKIFCRSPYWTVVDVPNQLEASVEVFIWNQGQSEPTTPTYTVQKNIPAANRTKLSFDLSPYIREFIEFERQTTPTAPEPINPLEFCNVRIKAYSDTTQISNETFIAFYGYGEFVQGWNPDNGLYSQSQGEYLYERNRIPSFVFLLDYDDTTDNPFRVQYRDLVGGNVTNVNLSTVTSIVPYEIALSTNNTAYDNGNIVAIQEEVESVWIDRHVIKMIPQCEPKYTPIKCDFVNKWGAWQSITFFKRSDETLEVKGSKYQLMPSSEDYSVYKGEMQSFNVNGKVIIKVNTGWVGEHYRDIIKQLMLSETILLDDKKVIIKTESIELFKKVNTKVINYEMTFEYAFHEINKVS
jgi:hypothetical protein